MRIIGTPAAVLSLILTACPDVRDDATVRDTATFVGPSATFGTDLWAGGELEHFRAEHWTRVADTKARPRGLFMPDAYRVVYGDGGGLRVSSARSGIELLNTTVMPGEEPRVLAPAPGGWILTTPTLVLDVSADFVVETTTRVTGGEVFAAASAAGHVALTLNDRGKCSLVVFAPPAEGARAERARLGLERGRCDSRDALAISDDAQTVWVGSGVGVARIDLGAVDAIPTRLGPEVRADLVMFEPSTDRVLLGDVEGGTLIAVEPDGAVAWETSFGVELRHLTPATDRAPGFATFDTGAPDLPAPTVWVSVGSEWEASGVARLDPADGRFYYEIWTDLVPNQIAVSPDGGALALQTHERVDLFIRRR